jgi:hypothetical protein
VGASACAYDYVAVHDNKGAGQPRLSLVRVGPSGEVAVHAVPCAMADAKATLPVDFESVCALPGTSSEFVAVAKEAGASPVRHLLCRLVLSWTGGTVTRTVPLAHLPASGADVEGFAVRRLGGVDAAVWAHRGGGTAPAAVYAGRLDLAAADEKDVLRLDDGPHGVSVDFFPACTDRRSVSALKIDAAGTVWATAACETPALDGALYRLGTLCVGADGKAALALATPYAATGRHPGRKVEALELMPERCGRTLLGSDDDAGGGWLRVPPR